MAWFTSAGDGPVTMLNLLRFREIADYTASPELAPANPISGEAAYDLYVKAAGPIITAAGSELIFMGKGGAALIGPTDERWDRVLLVRHPSRDAFRAFSEQPDYLDILGHRSAALADSRLFPLTVD